MPNIASAGHLRAAVEAARGLADDLELRRVLERRPSRGTGSVAGRVGELAVGERAGRRGRARRPFSRAQLGAGRPSTVGRRRGQQHRRARRAPALRRLLPLAGDARAAAGHLHAEHRVRVGRARPGAPPPSRFPVAVELLGDQHRQRRVDALAHLRLVHEDGDDVPPCRCAGRRWARSRRRPPRRLRGQATAARTGSQNPSRSRPQSAAAALRKSRREGAECSSRASPFSSGPRGLLDRRADALIGAAAADVPAHGRVDVRVGRRLRFLRGARPRHDLARTGSSRTAARPARSRPPAAGAAARRRAEALDGGDALAAAPRTAASRRTRRGAPSTCTVQAPHSAMPQPNLVPVSPRSSRSTQRSGLSGSAATVTARPFTLKVVMSRYLPLVFRRLPV